MPDATNAWIWWRKLNESYFLLIKPGAHLLPVFVQPVMGVVGHGGQKLQEAVESITVACWEQVDQ